MEYYLIITIKYNDGTAESKSIYSYETESEAIANFHKQMGGWMLKDTVKHILAVVMNSEGGIYKNETYTAPVVEDSTEEEETTEA